MLDHHSVNAILEEIRPWLIDTRRDIHAHPELGEREFRTAHLVKQALQEFGYQVYTEVAKTGVIGVLPTARATPLVLWRADMDALPIEEKTGLPFASRQKDKWRDQETYVAHMCGHDMHTTIALGAARILARLSDKLNGRVAFLFQPAEEGVPHGDSYGAQLVVEQGWLQRLAPIAAFALHCFPDLRVGTVGYTPKGAMAAVDKFTIKVQGTQTHGAYPQEGVDAVSIAAKIVSALETIVSREVDAREAAVITVGSIHGGNRFNIVPGEVEMIGTVRTLDPQMQDFVHERIHKVANGIATAWRGQAQVEILKTSPVTWNSEELIKQIRPTLNRVMGAENVLVIPPSMGGEDFAVIAHEVPGFYLRLGVRAEQPTGPFHSHCFNPDEQALVHGVRVAVHLLSDRLEQASACAATS